MLVLCIVCLTSVLCSVVCVETSPKICRLAPRVDAIILVCVAVVAVCCSVL